MSSVKKIMNFTSFRAVFTQLKYVVPYRWIPVKTNAYINYLKGIKLGKKLNTIKIKLVKARVCMHLQMSVEPVNSLNKCNRPN